jgi:hypothetical protein
MRAMRGVVAALLLFGVLRIGAQAPAIETAQEAYAKLSPEEKQSYDQAAKDFGAEKFGVALPVFKTLLAAHAGDVFLSKMAGESAIDVGDYKLAAETLQPALKQNPDDWMLVALTTRVYAETGDKAHRDAGMAHMAELYKRGLTPKQMTQYIVEKDMVGDKKVIIWNSLVPWGNFKVYNYARVFDQDGKMVERIQLESGDFDQPLWAKQHPKEAAAGGRMFSLDSYFEGPPNASGQRSTSQALNGFLDGQPTYDEVREYFMAIASGKGIKSVNGTIVK